MGFLDDVKKEWTWEGFKASLREDWDKLLAIFLAAMSTKPMMRWMGMEDSGWRFFLTYTLIAIAFVVVIGIAKGIMKRYYR